MYRAIIRPLAGGFLALGILAGTAPAQSTALKVGDRAPVFSGVDSYGKPWKSSDVVGEKIVVVYFYPAAMTGGCTTQACKFRDNKSTLGELGAEVIGVSGDRAENLVAFRELNMLNFPLLADTTGAIARAFGVPVKKGGSITRTIDGSAHEFTRDVTAERWTFIIDHSGKIAFKEMNADPDTDSETVINAIRQMQAL